MGHFAICHIVQALYDVWMSVSEVYSMCVWKAVIDGASCLYIIKG